jgi:branched-chain amino acid transport system substrate-binding protein
MQKHWIAGAVLAATSLVAQPSYAEDCGEIVLGAALSSTGKYSTNGENTKIGYEFAIKKIKEAGGVKVGGKCYNFKVIYYDDESTPARAAQLVERLISQDKVEFMLGPYSSGLTVAVAPVTEKYKIPMLESEAATRSLFNKGYKYIFAVLSTSEQYLSSAVDLAAEMATKNGKKPSDVKVAMVFESDPFSLDVRAGAVDAMKKHGMQAVIDDKMPRDLNDISPTLTKVKALKPDLLLISGHEKGAATAARQMGEMKIDVPIVGITHCESAKLTVDFKGVSDAFLCPTQWSETLTYDGQIFGSAANYDKEMKAYHTKYKTVPYQTAQASAAVFVYKDAFERAKSMDKEKVREALAATDLATFYGRVKFAPEGNNTAKPMVLRQIQDGNYVVVAPTKYATGKLEYPRKLR